MTRPESTQTLVLLLEILRRIPRNRKTSAKELHEQLLSAGYNRDLRTIQRHLEMLSTHFEIDCDRSSKPYGFQWRSEAKVLAVPELQPSESLLFQLAESYLSRLLPSKLMGSLEPFFQQAERNLSPFGKAQQEREWMGKVRVVATSQPLLPAPIRPDVFEAVSHALWGNLWLELDYRNAQGKRKQYSVMPLGLAQQGPALYLVCRFPKYDNERSLALHRILSAQVSTLGFERPAGFDLARYDADGRFGFGEGERISLRFCIRYAAGMHLLETPLAEDQVVQTLADGDLCIQATVVDSALLDRWLRGFGVDVWQIEKRPLAE